MQLAIVCSIGWLYCLSNPAMPGLLKIGKTSSNPSKRAYQLYTTSVPQPFKIEIAKRVNNFEAKERLIHNLLEKLDKRVNSNREFFSVDLATIKNIFELIDGEPFTPVYEIQNNEKIRHTISDTDIWYAKYDKLTNNVVYKNMHYTFQEFVDLHYCTNKPSFNGTKTYTCEYMEDNIWKPIHDIKMK